MLAWMVEDKGIEPMCCVGQGANNDETLYSSEFQWNEYADEYRCPGARLRSGYVHKELAYARHKATRSSTGTVRQTAQRANQRPLLPNTPIRKIARSIMNRPRAGAANRNTEQYRRSRCERKKVEMLFAHLKRILKLDRLRFRGLSGATDEFTLAAAVQNLRR